LVQYNEHVFAFVNTWLTARTENEPAPVVAWGRPGASAALEGVSHGFGKGGGESVLEDVSLTVRAGEFLCLVGPSGSGKSTILNLLAGLLAPARGRVLEGGRTVFGPAPDRTVVFQDAALFPWLTLRSNVEFPMHVRGIARAERAARSEQLLRLVHLHRSANAFPHELSGGMRQRGAIARALAADPALLLMDEPFAALDGKTREILQGELEDIWSATRKTIVFVTHDVREAVRLGDRVVLMATRPGRILREVPVNLPRPRSPAHPTALTLTREIGDLIASEVDKAAREEEGDAWMAPRSAVRGGARRAVGDRVRAGR
jgi:NitT/TauT family transport system ATP-binding protein